MRTGNKMKIIPFQIYTISLRGGEEQEPFTLPDMRPLLLRGGMYSMQMSSCKLSSRKREDGLVLSISVN